MLKLAWVIAMKPDKFIRPILIMSGVIFLLLFYLPTTTGIFHIGNTTGIICSLILILLGAFLTQVKKALGYLKARFWGRIILGAVGAVLLALALTVTVLTAGMIYGANLPSSGTEPVIVLGCKVNGDRPSLMLKRRLDTAAEYLLENKEVVCIVSGGQGAGESVPESEAMKAYLIKAGVSGERILTEARSTDTRENIQFSKEILEENNLGGSVMIISDGFHLWRASIIAKKEGLSPASTAAKTPLYLLPCYYVRELYGLLEEILLK